MNTLAYFNALSLDEAQTMAMGWCHCETWAVDVALQRPFVGIAELCAYCEKRWQAAAPREIETALAAHPLIGDVALLRAKFCSAGANDEKRINTAFAEQGQVLEASSETLAELARLNIAYKERHGFIFIIFAKDLSADEMLIGIQSRLNNSTAVELTCAADEQRKILLSRIEHVLGQDA